MRFAMLLTPSPRLQAHDETWHTVSLKQLELSPLAHLLPLLPSTAHQTRQRIYGVIALNIMVSE